MKKQAWRQIEEIVKQLDVYAKSSDYIVLAFNGSCRIREFIIESDEGVPYCVPYDFNCDMVDNLDLSMNESFEDVMKALNSIRVFKITEIVK